MDKVRDNEVLLKNQDLIDDFMGREHWRMAPNHAWYSYHNDWNKLMPVVEKIETIEDFQVTICSDFVNVSSSKGDGYYKNHSGVNKLESVYKAVLEFILWYTQIKQ